MIEQVRNGIYIAASWRRPDLKEIRDMVVEAGFVSTGGWLEPAIAKRPYEEHEGGILSEHAQHEAKKDLLDIERSSAVLTFPGPKQGVGHHHEYGYAIARRKPIVAVGEPWGVFHSLAEAWYPDTPEGRFHALVALRKIVGPNPTEPFRPWS